MDLIGGVEIVIKGNRVNKIIVTDDFYESPEQIVTEANNKEYVCPKDHTGFRSQGGYFPKNIRAKLQSAVGQRIIELEKPQGDIYDNGLFYLSFDKGGHQEVPGVHHDEPLDHMVCLIYLSKNIPLTCGTSFYRHQAISRRSAFS